MSARLATPSLLKTKIFSNEAFDVIILHYGVTSNLLSHDSNYIVNFFYVTKIS